MLKNLVLQSFGAGAAGAVRSKKGKFYQAGTPQWRAIANSR